MGSTGDRLREIVSATYRDFRANRTIRLGAGLAFYGLFAIAPLLTLSMALAVVVFDDEEVNEYLTEVVTDVIGDAEPETAQAIVDELDAAAQSLNFGIIGAATLVIGASLVFVAVEDAFNSIWNIPVRSGFRNAMRRRLRAFAVVLGAAALMIVGLAVQNITNIFEEVFAGRFEVSDTLIAAAGAGASLATLVGALALLYHELGPRDLRWRPAMVSATVAATAMTLSSAVLAVYLSRVGRDSIGGAAGGVLLVLLWIYYQAQILLAGAHLVRVLEGSASHDGEHAT